MSRISSPGAPDPKYTDAIASVLAQAHRYATSSACFTHAEEEPSESR
jgi:hypothetical protein